jgi:hypothetical protein
VSTNEDELYEGLGILDVGPGMKEGRSYAVPFTLFVDASSPHQALERAMQFRNLIGTGDPADVRSLPFDWPRRGGPLKPHSCELLAFNQSRAVAHLDLRCAGHIRSESHPARTIG